METSYKNRFTLIQDIYLVQQQVFDKITQPLLPPKWGVFFFSEKEEIVELPVKQFKENLYNSLFYFTDKFPGMEFVDLNRDHFLRPTHREPLIRAYYAQISLLFEEGRREEGARLAEKMGELRFVKSELGTGTLEILARDCVFSQKNRLL